MSWWARINSRKAASSPRCARASRISSGPPGAAVSGTAGAEGSDMLRAAAAGLMGSASIYTLYERRGARGCSSGGLAKPEEPGRDGERAVSLDLQGLPDLPGRAFLQRADDC